MSKIIYDPVTGEIASLFQCDDPEREQMLVSMNIQQGFAIMDAPGVQSPNNIEIDVTRTKHKIKSKLK